VRKPSWTSKIIQKITDSLKVVEEADPVDKNSRVVKMMLNLPKLTGVGAEVVVVVLEELHATLTADTDFCLLTLPITF